MPVTLVDRLPLPNLKVYTAGSVLLLSVAVYHALNVTRDPNWQANVTVQRGEALAAGGVAAAGDSAVLPEPPPLLPPDLPDLNATRNYTEQFADVITYMMQEPLCMWSVINMAYCSLAMFGLVIQRVVFGELRVAEAQRVKDKFWNYVFYKFIFVFGVINVQYMDEVLLWCSWFTLLGFLHLLGHLCNDRYQYLSSSTRSGGWAHARLALLLGGILAAGGVLLTIAVVVGLPAGRDTFAFMAAECVLVIVCALHVVARYSLRLGGADVAGPVAYYTHLMFDSVSLVVELVHVVHMVVYSNMLVSMASLVLLMQLRHLLHELQARLAKHRLYTERATHITRNCPMASKEEVEKNQDNCAICWEPMKEARKLPCAHLFHNSCLCQWVQQDASCPTCRRALSPAPAPTQPTPAPLAAPAPTPAPAPAAAPDRLFHFDGSRYVSWLPSFSVEVTRVRADLDPHLLDLMARQVQGVFPQFPLGVLAAELAASRSPHLTIEDILEGRLRPPPPSHQHQHQHQDEFRQADPQPEPTLSSASVAHAPAPAPHQHIQQVETRFPESASQREATLQRRKRQLVASARTRYLARLHAADAADDAAGGGTSADAQHS